MNHSQSWPSGLAITSVLVLIAFLASGWADPMITWLTK